MISIQDNREGIGNNNFTKHRQTFFYIDTGQQRGNWEQQQLHNAPQDISDIHTGQQSADWEQQQLHNAPQDISDIHTGQQSADWEQQQLHNAPPDIF